MANRSERRRPAALRKNGGLCGAGNGRDWWRGGNGNFVALAANGGKNNRDSLQLRVVPGLGDCLMAAWGGSVRAERGKVMVASDMTDDISKVVLGDFSVIDQGSHIALPTLEDSQGNTDCLL